MYHVGLHINEIRKLTEEDIINTIQIFQFNVFHHKTKQAHIHVLSNKAVEDLKKLILEYIVVFQKYGYKYLFGKDKPIHKKRLIINVNKDLAYTSQLANIAYNIKSHSFRINIVSNLLKITSIQNAADIISHDDIRSTLSYRRYAL